LLSKFLLNYHSCFFFFITDTLPHYTTTFVQQEGFVFSRRNKNQWNGRKKKKWKGWDCEVGGSLYCQLVHFWSKNRVASLSWRSWLLEFQNNMRPAVRTVNASNDFSTCFPLYSEKKKLFTMFLIRNNTRDSKIEDVHFVATFCRPDNFCSF